MKQLLIFILVLTMLVLPGCARNSDEVSEPEIDEDGYTSVMTDSNAPKAVDSEEIVSFQCCFSTLSLVECEELGNSVYTVKAELSGEIVNCQYSSSADNIEVSYETDASFMEKIQGVVSEFDLAQYNGIYAETKGLPDMYGAELKIVYDSGESISAYNNDDNYLSITTMIALKDMFCKEAGLQEQEDTKLQGEYVYSVFDGVYKAKLSNEGATESFVQVKGFNDFILLEYFDLYEGSVFSFWAEEFWPDESGYISEEIVSVMGKSQGFSLMSSQSNYFDLPQNRCITMTDDGIVLNYDDADAEYYFKTDEFKVGHSSTESLKEILSTQFDTHLDFDIVTGSEDVKGTWHYWNSWDSALVTFDKDGAFEMIWKTPGDPVAVFSGVWGFSSQADEIQIIAERVGYGSMPFAMTWYWEIDTDGSLYIYENDGVALEEVGGKAWFDPLEYEFFTGTDQQHAMGYLADYYDIHDSYIDENGIYCDYTYRLPQFIGDDSVHQEMNGEILDLFEPIINAEMEAVNAGEFLDFTMVDYANCVFEDILIVHIFAYGVSSDCETHSVYYFNLNTGERLYAKDIILDVLQFDENYFLDTVRETVEQVFIDKFSTVPEEDRQLYGYYDCLAWTVSDDAVNLDMPIYINEYGDIFIFAKIGSPAGSGIIWEVITPFVLGEG